MLDAKSDLVGMAMNDALAELGGLPLMLDELNK